MSRKEEKQKCRQLENYKSKKVKKNKNKSRKVEKMIFFKSKKCIKKTIEEVQKCFF